MYSDFLHIYIQIKLLYVKEKISDVLLEVILNEGFQANKQSIIDLVKGKRFCAFYYEGDEAGDPGHEEKGWRTDVQVVCYGKGYKDSHTGNIVNDRDYIRAWIGVNSKSASAKKTGRANRPKPGWRMFRTDRIKNWNLASQKNFTQPPASNFNSGGDGNIATIYAISDFTPGKTDTPDDLRKGSPKKPISPKDKKVVKPDDKGKKPTIPLTPAVDVDPDNDTDQPDEKKPEPTQHYASSRTRPAKPVVKVDTRGKIKGRVRNGKPIITVREDFSQILKDVIKDFIYN